MLTCVSNSVRPDCEVNSLFIPLTLDSALWQSVIVSWHLPVHVCFILYYLSGSMW